MDWPRLATGIAITIGVPFCFIVLPLLLGIILGRFIARGGSTK